MLQAHSLGVGGRVMIGRSHQQTTPMVVAAPELGIVVCAPCKYHSVYAYDDPKAKIEKDVCCSREVRVLQPLCHCPFGKHFRSPSSEPILGCRNFVQQRSR